MSIDKLLIQSDSQLVVGQVNVEYESRDPRMAKYVSLVKQRLGNFSSWKLEHILRDCNEKAEALAAIVASSDNRINVLSHLLSAGFFNYYYPGKSGGRGLPFLDRPNNTIYQDGGTPKRKG